MCTYLYTYTYWQSALQNKTQESQITAICCSLKTDLLDTYNNLTSGFKTEEEINIVKPTSTKLG